MPRGTILLPGTLGTELFYTSTLGQKFTYWINGALIAKDGMLPMAFDTNGVDPFPAIGKRLEVGFFATPLYDKMRERLRTGMPGSWKKLSFVYDWRRDPFFVGSALKNFILDNFTVEEPCYIVAHSLGGMIARLAWSGLRQVGQEARIKKIVTVGTPHYGCYSLADVYGLRDSVTNDLARFSRFIWPSSTIDEITGAQTNKLKNDVIRTINTWPAVYAMMPMIGPASVNEDPHASRWYDITLQPQDLWIQNSWLQWARNTFQPVFLGATASPPREVLKCVAGTGSRTAVALEDGTKMPSQAAYEYTTEGDGVVSCWSALAGSTNCVVVKGEHQLLIQHPEVIEKMPAWLLEEDPPPPEPERKLIDQGNTQVGAPSYSPDITMFLPKGKADDIFLPGGGACVLGACKC